MKPNQNKADDLAIEASRMVINCRFWKWWIVEKCKGLRNMKFLFVIRTSTAWKAEYLRMLDAPSIPDNEIF